MSRTRRPPSSTGQRSRGSGRGKPTAPAAADRARALALTPVSRETLERLDRFVALLLTWQRTTNLIAPSTVLNLWTRHIADSLQLLSFVPDARIWVGLVIACALADRPGAHFYLVESNHKKAAFLREAQRLTAAPATVHATRGEEFVASFEGRADVVTARALAPLKPLLDQCFPLLGKNGAVGLFPKGRHAELELREARESAAKQGWTMTAALMPSRIEPAGHIVVIRDVERRS